MAKISAAGVAIQGIQTCVPRQCHKNMGGMHSFSNDEVEKIVKMAGVEERRIVEEGVCTSDLCVEAANKLMNTLGWQRETIDLLVFITQTSDHISPSTACLIQRRLSLTEDCAAFDVNLGCSAYPYGLCLASKMMQGDSLRRALLLVGETPSKVCHSSDRSTSLIFGDVGSATALEVSSLAANMFCVLRTDGGGAGDFIVPAGGFRDRFNPDPKKHFIEMNGPGIFAFTMRAVPALLGDVLAFAQLSREEVDYFVFHQANLFIIEHLRKKMKLPKEKVPVVIGRYGNTGGGSVPLTMTQGGLKRGSARPLQLVLLGYGVGLSWAAATVELMPACLLGHSEL
jgi:3-oxoacyl-[acyl-carrier-protein] synthase-3